MGGARSMERSLRKEVVASTWIRGSLDLTPSTIWGRLSSCRERREARSAHDDTPREKGSAPFFTQRLVGRGEQRSAWRRTFATPPPPAELVESPWVPAPPSLWVRRRGDRRSAVESWRGSGSSRNGAPGAAGEKEGETQPLAGEFFKRARKRLHGGGARWVDDGDAPPATCARRRPCA